MVRNLLPDVAYIFKVSPTSTHFSNFFCWLRSHTFKLTKLTTSIIHIDRKSD